LKKNINYFERALDYYKKGNAAMAAKLMQDLVENEAKNAIKYVYNGPRNLDSVLSYTWE